MQQSQTRIHWLDVAKGIGIFLIFFGHFADLGGSFYLFVYDFHVAFFFLLAGILSSRGLSRPFWEQTKLRFKQLMIPYFAFCFLMVAVFSLNANVDISLFAKDLLNIFLFRDYNISRQSVFFVNSRWFLAALFLMAVLYDGLCRLVKQGYIRFFICLAAFISVTLLLEDPRHYPTLPFCFDRVLYYMIFYCIGDLCSTFLFTFFSAQRPQKAHILAILLLGFTTFILYFNIGANLINSVPFFLTTLGMLFRSTVRALLLCSFFIILSYFLKESRILRCWGMLSLWLCCGEQLTRFGISAVLSLVVNVDYSKSTPATIIFLTVIYLFVCQKLLAEPIVAWRNNLKTNTVSSD